MDTPGQGWTEEPLWPFVLYILYRFCLATSSLLQLGETIQDTLSRLILPRRFSSLQSSVKSDQRAGFIIDNTFAVVLKEQQFEDEKQERMERKEHGEEHGFCFSLQRAKKRPYVPDNKPGAHAQSQ